MDGRVFRIVRSRGLPALDSFLPSNSCQRFVDSGRLIRSDILDVSAPNSSIPPAALALCRELDGKLLIEHPRIFFPSYPYEWPPEMLHAAAELTLDLASEALEEGFGLKDATPYNLLFCGPRGAFVDLLSFEIRAPGDPTWLAHAQFVRTFLLPLLVNRHFGVRLDQIFTTAREGIEPETVYPWLTPIQRLLPPFLGLVSGPKWMSGRNGRNPEGIYVRKDLANHEKAQFILGALLNRLRRALKAVRPISGTRSAWSGYMPGLRHYSNEQFDVKREFVQQVMNEFNPGKVLDVGCNSGHFSGIAAKSGARVVAIDQDPVVVGETWRMACAGGLDILPLVVNLAHPSPSLGWRNQECRSFLERAQGSFDAVFMLAVLHHLLVTERIPLDAVLDLAAELTTDLLVIEFVGNEDPMFRRLLRGREELHRDVNRESFEASCLARFAILRSQSVNGTRWLYLLRRKGPLNNA